MRPYGAPLATLSVVPQPQAGRGGASDFRVASRCRWGQSIELALGAVGAAEDEVVLVVDVTAPAVDVTARVPQEEGLTPSPSCAHERLGLASFCMGRR